MNKFSLVKQLVNLMTYSLWCAIDLNVLNEGQQHPTHLVMQLIHYFNHQKESIYGILITP